MEEIIEPKVQVLIGLGAATAAKCQPCFVRLYAMARELGISDVEVRAAVGLALNRGDVAYGNIGGPERLDFTGIGSAVNQAIRIEASCRRLAEPVLASGTFA